MSDPPFIIMAFTRYDFFFPRTLILRTNGFLDIFVLRDLLYVPHGKATESLTSFEITPTVRMLHKQDRKNT